MFTTIATAAVFNVVFFSVCLFALVFDTVIVEDIMHSGIPTYNKIRF